MKKLMFNLGRNLRGYLLTWKKIAEDDAKNELAKDGENKNKLTGGNAVLKRLIQKRQREVFRLGAVYDKNRSKACMNKLMFNLGRNLRGYLMSWRRIASEDAKADLEK